MQSFLSSISSNLLTQPAYIIGLLVFVGMVALKRPVYEAVASMVKAVVGYFILSIGSGGFTSTFRPIVNALASKFNITAALIDTYTQQAQMNDPVEGFFASYLFLPLSYLCHFHRRQLRSGRLWQVHKDPYFIHNRSHHSVLLLTLVLDDHHLKTGILQYAYSCCLRYLLWCLGFCRFQLHG